MTCQFKSQGICQSSLSFAFEREPSGFNNQWQDKSKTLSTLEIRFQEETFVRYIFTALNIEKLYVNGEPLVIEGSTWEPDKSTSFEPRIITLPKPILTKNLMVYVAKADHEHLTKFSLGGCEQNSTKIDQLHVTMDDMVYFIGNSSATYNQAMSEACGNGSLAIIYDTEKLFDFYPLTKYDPPDTLYFFGKKIINVLTFFRLYFLHSSKGLSRNATDQWVYANGNPLTKSGIIQGFVNYELDCIGIAYNKDDPNTLSFSSIDCIDTKNFKPMCQIPKVQNMEDLQDEEIFGKC